MSFFQWLLRTIKSLLDYAPTSIALKDIQSIVQEIFALDPVQDMNGGLEFLLTENSKVSIEEIK